MYDQVYIALIFKLSKLIYSSSLILISTASAGVLSHNCLVISLSLEALLHGQHVYECQLLLAEVLDPILLVPKYTHLHFSNTGSIMSASPSFS